MRKLCLWISVVFMSIGIAFAAEKNPTLPAPPTPPAGGAYYLVQFTTGPAWVTDKPAHEQPHFATHSANLKRLRSEEKLVLGARYADKGIILLRAATEAEARAALDADESVKAGVFTAEVFEFKPFYEGCVTKPSAK